MTRPLGCLHWDKRPHVVVTVSLTLVFPAHFLPSPEQLTGRMEDAARLMVNAAAEMPAGVGVSAHLEGYHIREDSCT